MEGISFTAHVSNKKSAITSKSKLAGVAKHNLRKYKSEEYSADNIFLIYGTDNLVHDVKAVYHQEFDEAVKVYNENQFRADRKIEDYYEHVANKEQDMAVEIIIQVGDRAYWQEHCENKVFMRRIYRMLLEELQYQLPQFVVANAVVHMDEDSPHMHFVRNDMKFIMNNLGCPVRDNFYIIKPQIDEYLMLALLNNFFTYYQLEKNGKKYGAGLLKLQRYDIEALKFPDISSFSIDDKVELVNLAKDLVYTGNKINIIKITEIMAKYSKESFEMITNMYEKIRKFRLEGKE